MKANEKNYNVLMAETTFQHVSTSKMSCISFIVTSGTDIFINGTISITGSNNGTAGVID